MHTGAVVSQQAASYCSCCQLTVKLSQVMPSKGAFREQSTHPAHMVDRLHGSTSSRRSEHRWLWHVLAMPCCAGRA
jgi:hypothetical protein